MEVDYYFSLISPFTYLGHERFEELAKTHGALVNYRVVDMPRVFSASGTQALKDRPAQRKAYRMMELRRWRDRLGIQLNLEPAHFPVPHEEAVKFVIAALRQGSPPGGLIGGYLRAVWAEERDISDSETVRAIAAEAGYDAGALAREAGSSGVREVYEADTGQAIADGVFGMPTWKIGAELFWGQDRLDFVAEALRKG